MVGNINANVNTKNSVQNNVDGGVKNNSADDNTDNERDNKINLIGHSMGAGVSESGVQGARGRRELSNPTPGAGGEDPFCEAASADYLVGRQGGGRPRGQNPCWFP